MFVDVLLKSEKNRGGKVLLDTPLAGQGIRFALSSAFAAASVINTWRTEPSQAAAAERFYEGFVARCSELHFQFIDQIRGESIPPQQWEAIPDVVVFSGRTVISEVQVDSRIRTGEVVVLPDGHHVRWVEGLDLLRLRDLVSQPIHSSDLMDRLVPAFCGVERFTALMQWCLQHHVLSPAQADSSFEPSSELPGNQALFVPGSSGPLLPLWGVSRSE